MAPEALAKQPRGQTSVRKGQAVAWRVTSLVPAPNPLGPSSFPEAIRPKSERH